EDLNSFSTTKLDEPDFERRSKAFGIINEDKYLYYSVKQWRPLIYNMLYYIKDTEELSIRVNASYALRRFIDAANARSEDADYRDRTLKTFGTVEQYEELIESAILPGIRNGMRESSELVRIEYLSVLAHLVRRPRVSSV